MSLMNFLFGKNEKSFENLRENKNGDIKLLNRKELVVAIENMIRDEKDAVLLLSPYIKLSEDIADILKNSKAKIRLIMRKPFEKDKEEHEKNLAEIETKLPKLRGCISMAKDLHAKVYMTTSKIVIASMNLHEYSEKNNFEVGFVLDNNLDNEICKKLYEEILGLFSRNNISENFLKRLYYTKRCSICNVPIKDKFFEKNRLCYECDNKRKETIMPKASGKSEGSIDSERKASM